MLKIQYRTRTSGWQDEFPVTVFDKEGANLDIDVLYTVNDQTAIYSAQSTEDWLTIEDRNGTWISSTERLESYIVHIAPNNTMRDRKGELVFTIQNSGDIYSNSPKLTQEYNWVAVPCWMDYYYEGGAETLDYYIECDGIGIIYNGRAYLQPKTKAIKINISKIIQDYLSNTIYDADRIINDTDFSEGNFAAIRQFYLCKTDGTILKVVNFRYDWSYEMRDIYEEILTTPINGHKDPRMIALGTEIKDGEYYYNSIYPELYKNEYCGDYALYYLQRNGGYAAFLIEGLVKKTDNYKKYSYNRAFDNTKVEFEECTYHNEISTEWTLNTGWLTDEQSENLAFNLLPSNIVYLHDLKNNKLMPVVINENTADYRTFKNNGKQLVNYTIKVAESQKKQLL